ncbi:hypothetical protein [Hymenobacter cheonanensis]|uniref:hypothetical protein n=1 Tax=Hymenobacter sp. CA2-7 TaxID=3063993 RepID=UPI00271341D9|nr:hypothetical protein [Hymenobacter sp. CA2-7]MDO7888234.1 hypothetical protein [Hymenobacter sp. CA2-7]
MRYPTVVFASFATRTSCLIFLLLTSHLGVHQAAAQDTTLVRLARRYQYSLQANGTQYSGLGWEKIRADVQKSQFVLLGEDHGTVQIPQFATAVARELKPALYAPEVDPYVAATLTQLAAQPKQARAYLQQYPGALCFGSLAEEFDLVCVLRTQQTRVMGLDQIFIINAAPFYQQLAAQAKGAAARAYLHQRATAYQAQEQANLRQGSQTFVLLQQTPAAIDSLLTFTKKESLAVQKMAQDYAASYRIYMSGSHQARLSLLKRNLLQELRVYQTATELAAPKMLFKFGAQHLARGGSPISGGEYYDLGNLVQNLADVQGQQSLHILVLGKQGTRISNLAGLLSANQNPESYTSTSYENGSAFPVKLFMDQVHGPDWSAFDLRPLRTALAQGKMQLPSRALERIITGYDYFVIIPETTAGHPIP